MSTIFVSHSAKDFKRAKVLGNWLQQQGHTSYFLDFDPDKGIAAGKRWESEIYRHLRLCRSVIALLTPSWLESRWCFAEITHARAAGKPVFLAKVEPCETDQVFKDIQQVDLTANQIEGYQRLARGLQEVGIEPGEAFEWDSSRPPFPGLLAFQEEDAAIFFGRERDIQKGLEILNFLRHKGGPSFILCLGASGSGKSSLLRAGLIPRLRKDKEAWLPVATCRPQENPLEEIAINLARVFRDLGEHRDWKLIYEKLFHPHIIADWEDPPDKLPLTGEGLIALARDLRVLAGHQEATVLLPIDQAEELFGYSDVHKSRGFLQCLRGALEIGGHRLMVVATMRSDALGSFQTHPDLQDFAYEPFTVDPIPVRNLPQIIEGPAHLAGIEIEPGLVQSVVQDVTTSDALPLLAFTLRELYEKCSQGRRLQIRDYEALGRIEGSVHRAANRIITSTSLNPEEMAALRVAFVPAMIRVNEDGDFIRRRASWLDLPARAHNLLQRFVDERLLVSRGEGGERVIEVAHEALLRTWPLLKDWLREDLDKLRLLDDLRRAAERWHTHGRDESWLIHYGERLQAIEEMQRSPRFGKQLGQMEKDYLGACAEKRRQEQERVEREASAVRNRLKAEAKAARRMRVIALIAVVAAGAAIFAWYQSDVAEERRIQVLTSRAKFLISTSRQQTDLGSPTRGILLALEVLSKHESIDRPLVSNAEASLLHALFAQHALPAQSAQPEMPILRGHKGGINKVSIAPQGLLVATASRDHTARLWHAETGEVEATLQGHTGQIYWVEFSHDGQKVVTASSDGTARLWNTADGKTITILRGHDGDVYQSSFSPDDRFVVTASEDRTARLWNAQTGQALLSLRGHKGDVWQASFSADSKRVVTASLDKTARIWDVETGKLLMILPGHKDMVIQAKFSPDGQRIITASWDHTARLWDALTGKVIASLEGHRDGVGHAAFTPDGRLVVTTSADGTARLWNAITGESVAVLEGHQGLVHDAAFSPDGRWLVTSADDGTARLWDVAARVNVNVFRGHTARVWSVYFSPNGRRVATASEDGTARIWKVDPDRSFAELRGHEDRVHRAIFSPPDGRLLVTVSEDKTARIWNAQTGENIAVLTGHTGPVWYAVFSKDGRNLVTTSTDGTARLWDSETGRLVHTFSGHKKGLVYHAHFSPNGQQVVTAAADETARVWDTVSGEDVIILQGHRDKVYFAEFSQDGRRILTTSQDNTARLWNAASGELIKSLEHQGPVINAAFSPDNKRLVTASWDRTGRLWDSTTGELISKLEGHLDAVLAAAFSPDGRLVVTASSDNTARIWNAESGQSLFILQGHTGEVYDACFSADGRLILTASGDNTARIWHAASGQPVARLRGHRDKVVSARFSPLRRNVATASWDHTARLWELPSFTTAENWIVYAQKTVPRKLTADERRRYLED